MIKDELEFVNDLRESIVSEKKEKKLIELKNKEIKNHLVICSIIAILSSLITVIGPFISVLFLAISVYLWLSVLKFSEQIRVKTIMIMVLEITYESALSDSLNPTQNTPIPSFLQ